MATKPVRLIENIIRKHYGEDAMKCEPQVVGMAADLLQKRYGTEVAAQEWKKLNTRREKIGVRTSKPQFGTAMYVAFCLETPPHLTSSFLSQLSALEEKV